MRLVSQHSWFDHLRTGLLADWLPSPCLQCGRCDGPASAGGVLLCARCADALPGRHRQRCAQCAVPYATLRDAPRAEPAARCRSCRQHPPAFDLTWALADYADDLPALIIAMKSRRPEFARVLAALMASDPGCPRELDLIVPVPLAVPALAARGFNQSVELGRPLARALNTPFRSRLLRRVRSTAAQKSLDRVERSANLQGAFALANPRQAAQIDGLTVGVVDDVMTTGATMQGIAELLRSAGARRIVNLIVARTP